ncbi:cupredoxin domain-containing protein [Haloarchaeobius litoreus]|uniref:Plastocyanin/azurin family copper-binding protein n=1 Tax=Haloarchaeobius litoreus TaxID=755306 RepID=A0ABD6DHK4_9EURY|nr:plastocyanin/azurin family copper-binding protein [Haloarchaeobius litoreus]
MPRKTHTSADGRGDVSTATDGPVEPPDTGTGVGRRALLWALGAGAALTSAGSAPVTAESDAGQPEIDPLYGYATPDASAVPSGLQPDHTVELHVEEGGPWEPGRPQDTVHGPLFHFEPVGLAVEPGEVVQFTFKTPDHSVTAYHPAHGYQQRVPQGVPPFSSPVVGAGGAWLYRFDEPGLYDVFCAPHHILGMAMRLVVGELAEEDVPSYEDTFQGDPGPPPLLAPFSKQFLEGELEHFSRPGENVNLEWVWLTPQEVLDTDALDPSNIQAEDGSVSFEAVLADIDRIEVAQDDG